MKYSQSKKNKTEQAQSLQEMQKMIACFEEEVLLHIPSKEEVLIRAKKRRQQRKYGQNGLLVLLSSTLILYLYNPSYQRLTLHTAVGEQRKIDLSDGSQIHLNSNSLVTVSEKFRSRELVLHRGEASFKVQHSDSRILKCFERVFSVNAGDLYIRDIGTVFNVNKINQNHSKVTVLEGEVAAALTTDKHKLVYLSQGQSIENIAGQLQPMTQADLNATTAWQLGKVIFYQTPLQQAIVEFQRYHDFEVLFDQPKTQNIHVFGQFNSNNYQ